jgi:SAM-dependent methyltransferase
MAAHADPSRDFDPSELAARADLEATHYWHVHRRAVILDEVRRILAPGGPERLVEVGCGVGTVATHLNAAGYHVDYADVFDEALELARRGAEARVGPAAATRRYLRIDAREPWPIEGADGVLLCDVVEHLDDDAEALRHARRALGRGSAGFVLITVPAFSFLWSPWDVIERHKRRYTRASLADVLGRAGFEVERITYFFLPLFFAALGAKAVRAARDALLGGTAARFGETLETAHGPFVDRGVLALTTPERAFLGRGDLPFGTSLIAVARPAAAP